MRKFVHDLVQTWERYSFYQRNLNKDKQPARIVKFVSIYRGVRQL
jgi:hypothetical protein